MKLVLLNEKQEFQSEYYAMQRSKKKKVAIIESLASLNCAMTLIQSVFFLFDLMKFFSPFATFKKKISLTLVFSLPPWLARGGTLNAKTLISFLILLRSRVSFFCFLVASIMQKLFHCHGHSRTFHCSEKLPHKTFIWL